MAIDYPIDPAHQAILLSLSALSGSLTRFATGWLESRLGPRRAGQLGLLAATIALAWGWLGVRSAGDLYALALLLGLAGASGSSALAWIRRAHREDRRGLATAFAGAGGGGMIVALLFAARLAQRPGGWEAVFGWALLPLGAAFVAFSVLTASAAPGGATKPARLRGRRIGRDVRLASLAYGIAGGGWIGVAAFVPLFFHTQFGQSAVAASDGAAACVVAGSLLRPFGGWLAERLGTLRAPALLLGGAGVSFAALSFSPAAGAAAGLLCFAMLCLGAAGAAILELAARRSPGSADSPADSVDSVGSVGSVSSPEDAVRFVHAAGGWFGCVPPLVLGFSLESAGTSAPGFLILGGATLAGLLPLLAMRRAPRSVDPAKSRGSSAHEERIERVS